MSEQLILYLFGVILSFAAAIFFFFRQRAEVSVRQAAPIRAVSLVPLLAILLNLISAVSMISIGQLAIAMLFVAAAGLFSFPLLKQLAWNRRPPGG